MQIKDTVKLLITKSVCTFLRKLGLPRYRVGDGNLSTNEFISHVELIKE